MKIKEGKRYTREELAELNSLNLVSLLQQAGYALVPDNKGEFHLAEHDSLKISEYKGWHWFSRDIGGGNIDFFMTYEDLDFLSAVERINSLLGTELTLHHTEKPEAFSKEPKEKREYRQPERNADDKRVFAYLCKKRCIDAWLVKKLLKEGPIYEAKDTHNLVFLGKDYDGNVVSSFERGTTDKKYARDTFGSDKNFRFRLLWPDSKKVNVFEAEIDMLSYITMYGLKEENYIALGGVSPLALDTFLEKGKSKINHINLCLDNDDAGRAAKEKLRAKYEAAGIYVTESVPMHKDFNEDVVMAQAEMEATF